MKICVIGAGAMGCSYGGLLSRAGHALADVLVRKAVLDLERDPANDGLPE